MNAMEQAAKAGLDKLIATTSEAILTGKPWASETVADRRASCLLLRDAVADYETVTGGEVHSGDGLYTALEMAGVDVLTGRSSYAFRWKALWRTAVGVEAMAAITAFSKSLEASHGTRLAVVGEWP